LLLFFVLIFLILLLRFFFVLNFFVSFSILSCLKKLLFLLLHFLFFVFFFIALSNLFLENLLFLFLSLLDSCSKIRFFKKNVNFVDLSTAILSLFLTRILYLSLIRRLAALTRKCHVQMPRPGSKKIEESNRSK